MKLPPMMSHPSFTDLWSLLACMAQDHWGKGFAAASSEVISGGTPEQWQQLQGYIKDWDLLCHSLLYNPSNYMPIRGSLE